jgi:MraZ protein
VDIERHLRATGNAEDLFITSFDGKYARIYTTSGWESQEVVLETPDDDAPTGGRLLFTAKRYGSDASVDNQGRLLLPPLLRKEMGVENQPVWVTWIKEHIAVMSDEEFQRQSLGPQDSSEAIRIYEKKGLK